MRHQDISVNSSENRKDGLKNITQAVFQLLKENKVCTYSFICENLMFPNVETMNRRIYDVLNVMKAVKLIDKRGKKYFLVSDLDSRNKRKEEIKRLVEMKEMFEFIVDRNSNIANINHEKLHLPFMVISTDKLADISCETNEERTFFTFKSSKPLRVSEDLDILREIYRRTNFSEECREDVNFDSVDKLLWNPWGEDCMEKDPSSDILFFNF